MAEITLLQLQRKRSDRVNVFLDEEYAFSVALVLAETLKRGQRLSPAEIDALQTEDAYREALDRSIGLLARRPRSRVEIERALERKEIPADVVQRVVERLVELDYLDDDAFAAWWVQNRQTHRPRGRWALRQELSAKGVGSDAIAAAIVAVDEQVVAREVALRRAPRYRGLDREGLTTKLGAYLRRRGFPYQAVHAALDAAWEELHAGDDDPDG